MTQCTFILSYKKVYNYNLPFIGAFTSVPLRHVGDKGEWRYSSYSFLTSALDGGEWSASRPGRSLSPEKDPRYPLDSRLGGRQKWSAHKG
jgi:hypothetical protein